MKLTSESFSNALNEPSGSSVFPSEDPTWKFWSRSYMRRGVSHENIGDTDLEVTSFSVASLMSHCGRKVVCRIGIPDFKVMNELERYALPC